MRSVVLAVIASLLFASPSFSMHPEDVISALDKGFESAEEDSDIPSASSSLANSTELKRLTAHLGDETFLPSRAPSFIEESTVQKPPQLRMEKQDSAPCCEACCDSCCDSLADRCRACCLDSSECMHDSVCCMISRDHGEPCATCSLNTGCWFFCCPCALYLCGVKSYNKWQEKRREKARREAARLVQFFSQ